MASGDHAPESPSAQSLPIDTILEDDLPLDEIVNAIKAAAPLEKVIESKPPEKVVESKPPEIETEIKGPRYHHINTN